MLDERHQGLEPEGTRAANGELRVARAREPSEARAIASSELRAARRPRPRRRGATRRRGRRTDARFLRCSGCSVAIAIIGTPVVRASASRPHARRRHEHVGRRDRITERGIARAPARAIARSPRPPRGRESRASAASIASASAASLKYGFRYTTASRLPAGTPSAARTTARSRGAGQQRRQAHHAAGLDVARAHAERDLDARATSRARAGSSRASARDPRCPRRHAACSRRARGRCDRASRVPASDAASSAG